MCTSSSLSLVATSMTYFWIALHVVCPGLYPAMAAMALAWTTCTVLVLGPTVAAALSNSPAGVGLWAGCILVPASIFTFGIIVSPVVAVAAEAIGTDASNGGTFAGALPAAPEGASAPEQRPPEIFTLYPPYLSSWTRRQAIVAVVRAIASFHGFLSAWLLVLYDYIVGESTGYHIRYGIQAFIAAIVFIGVSSMLLSSAIARLANEVSRAKEDASASRMQHVKQFLRYVFHEARVPLQAVVLGLEEVQDILLMIRKESKRRRSSRPDAVDRRRTASSTGSLRSTSRSDGHYMPLLSPSRSPKRGRSTTKTRTSSIHLQHLPSQDAP